MDKRLKKIIIVSPVYNEELYLAKFIRDLLAAVKDLPQVKKIIFVNDGSTDKSLSILKKYQSTNRLIEVITHKKNLGKGRALWEGFHRAKKIFPDAVIFLDSDQQHLPHHLSDFIDNLSDYPIILGYRKLSKSSPFLRRIGNEIAKFIIRKLFHIHRQDLLCGFMAFRQDVFSYLNWQSDDYGVETEISTIIGKNNLPFKEINIKNIYLDRHKGVNIFHAFLILLRIPFWYFRSSSMLFGLLVILSMVGIFGLLAGKNPFGIRSLVANLEPFPDTLYYSAPAWNFVKGNGFNMSVFGWQTKLIIPPLYSFFLIPFFGLFNDVRSFYLANILLLTATIILYLFWLKKIFKNDWLVIGLIGFLLVTNFYFYNLPSLLLAENMSLFFMVLALYLLTTKEIYLSSFLGVGFWLIKFSNLPLGLVFYFLKSWQSPKRRYWMGVGFLLLVFIGYLVASKILIGHKNLSAATGFSLGYLKNNFVFYFKNLIGLTGQFLWFRQPMFSPLIGIIAFIGFIAGLFTKQWRRLSLNGLLIVFSLVVFMSFFYAPDTRYIITILPLWLVGVGIFFTGFKLRNKMILILFFLIIYLFYNSLIIKLKNQIVLNLKYKEDPWNYLAVRQFNQFFSQSQNQGGYLGTFLPPFYINYFTNDRYHYLPLIETQDFFPGEEGFLKQMGIRDIKDFYRKLLKQNKKIFVSNYYTANLKEWQEYFESLKENFNLELKQEGCYNVCNIYEIR